MYVKATVISKYKDYLIIDSGSKILELDKVVHDNSNMESFGVIMENSDFVIARLSQEHGVIEEKSIKNIQIKQIFRANTDSTIKSCICAEFVSHSTPFVFLKTN